MQFKMGLLAVGITVGLAINGISTVHAAKWYERNVSYQTQKKHNKLTYKLAFFENVADNDTESQYYVLGWYDSKGKIHQKKIWSAFTNYSEYVDPNLKIPYVVMSPDGDAYYIHRPPYTMYNQPAVEGTVSAKE